MQGSLFRVLLLVLSLAVFSQASQSAAYQITVLATNISDYGGLGEWSFAALFKGEQDAVLFDTGFKEDTVLHNVLHLGVDLSGVEKVVLSHFHSDHTGGLLILRKQRFPDETPYHYQPLSAAANDYRWDEVPRADLKDYHLDDLSI